MNIATLHQLFLESTGVSTDTRKVSTNNIFFALKGENFNGNKFALDAINKGASYAIVDEDEYSNHHRCIVVEDSLKTLQDLASFHRSKLHCPVLGITGSNGKTTTKELISSVLSTQLKVVSTKGNLNNHIGVPLTILSADLDTEFLIVEMGANHRKEIKFLSEIADIDFGIITNIGKAHLEGFGSLQGIIDTKKELYDYIGVKNGKLFVNKNDVLLQSLSKGMNKLEYSINPINTSSPFAAIEFKGINIQSQLIGYYNCANISAACFIGDYFNISVSNLKLAIESYQPKNNRSQLSSTTQNNSLILDAYNANPSSMLEAITSFTNITHNKKVLILGDMLELGNESTKEHQNIVDLLSEINSKVILVGKEFSKCSHQYTHFMTIEACKNWLKNLNISDSLILLKGSRGIRLEELQRFL
ncbi:MAG: UDP-N-acetylmuramoyl-tripeptide--D-alanyl-D-alanine ligase [Flavobacteriales bacterium]